MSKKKYLYLYHKIRYLYIFYVLLKESKTSMQWKRRKVKRDYYHIIIKFPLKNISLQIEARSTFLWLNPSYILNSKSRNTVLLLKHGVWWVFSSKTLLDFKETLITLLVVRPKLEWASNYEMKEEGHLLQTKESRELLSWISSKEKFVPHNKTFTTISDERWAIIQTRWNGFVCASEDQSQHWLMRPFRKLTQDDPSVSPRPPSLSFHWLGPLAEIYSDTRKHFENVLHILVDICSMTDIRYSAPL